MSDHLDAIRTRLEDATPGPWHATEKTARWSVYTDKLDVTPSGWERSVPLNDEFRDGFKRGDAEFIAHAPEDVAYLLAEVERLSAEIEDYDSINTKMSDLLTRTADALKGGPKPLHLHDWSDLPDVAARLTTELATRGANQ